MPSTWIKAVIRLAGERLPDERFHRGIVCEGLGISRSWDKNKFCITHLASGAMIASQFYLTQREAKEAAEKFLGLEGFWLKTHAEMIEVVRDREKRERVHARISHVLGMPITGVTSPGFFATLPFFRS